MTYKRHSFILYLTEDEGSLIQNSIHDQITKTGWKNFFTDLRTDGDSCSLIEIYRQINGSNVIYLTSFQLYLVQTALRKAYNKYHLESLGKLIEDIKEIS